LRGSSRGIPFPWLASALVDRSKMHGNGRKADRPADCVGDDLAGLPVGPIPRGLHLTHAYAGFCWHSASPSVRKAAPACAGEGAEIKTDASGRALQAPAVRFVTRRRKAGGNLVLRVPAQHGRFGAVVAVLFDIVCHFSDEALVFALVCSAGFHAGFSILFDVAGQHFISRGMRPAIGSRSAEGFNGVGWREGSFNLPTLSIEKGRL